MSIPDQHAMTEPSKLGENEFRASDLAPGQAKLLRLDGDNVAVFNVDGNFFATQEHCTHQGGPLSEGTLDGNRITCPLHGSRFDVTTGAVVRGPAARPLKTYHVEVKGDIASVTKSS
jgi:nitrite reductase/ring-hydroxylating ferredoxin subunit